MSRACRLYLRAAACAWMLALVLFLLAGCGGGNADEDDTKAPNPPDCKAQPELCQ